MNQRDYEKAIEREVEEWPGVTVEFATGGKHPKAKFTFDGKMLAQAYAGTPSDGAFGVHQMLGDMRRVMKKLGATRLKPEPSKDEDEAPYRKAVEQPAKADKVVRADTSKAKPQPDVADQLVAAGAATEEQATIARASREPDTGRALTGQSGHTILIDEVNPDDAAAQLRAAFEERVAGIVDGIYFGLPADVYHAVPRLSSSGIQKLCVSPATFWRGSWLDPDRPDPDEDETIWQLLGRAYHTARLEPHLFESTYFRELVKDEAPKGTLFTATEMSKQLEEYGLKKTGSVMEQAERLLDAGFPGERLWHIVKARWETERGARTALPAKHFDQMLTDRDRIGQNSQIAPLLSGGEAEVSVFWTDEHGVKMKARVDYLTRQHWADFKTFDNSRGKHLNQALTDAVRYNRYYIQAPVYREAVEQIRVGGLQIVEADTDDQRSLIATLQMTPGELQCWYIFQEKGGVPNLLAREFPFYEVPYTTILNDAGASAERIAIAHEATKRRTGLFRKGAGDALEAKKLFVLYSEVYQAGEPWFPLDAIGRFSDEDFHPYWLDGLTQ
jgi:hypothetical protein